MEPSHPIRARSRRSTHPAAALAAMVGAAVLVVAPLAAASPAAAQVAEAWVRATPIEALGVWHSARLTAMGDLTIASEDRFSRLNAYEYGMNPAGLLSARDTSWVEQGSEYEKYEDTYYDQSNSAHMRKSGIRGAAVKDRWALGADVVYGAISASRHDLLSTPDNGRFIRDFDMPFATSARPILGDRTVGATVSYPGLAVSYARRFRPWLTLGGRFGYRKETENRRIVDPYNFDASATASAYTAGAVIRPPRVGHVVRIAGFGQYIKNDVLATSQTPLNDDRFDWERPTVAYGAELLVRSGSLRGIVDGRHRSYDGEQVANVNWAPQFFMNPFPSTTDPRFVFKKRWSSFLAGLRHNEVSTRWMADLPWLSAHLGLEWGYYREFEWVRPNPAVLQMALPLDVRRLGYRAGTGIAVDLPGGAGQVAAEVRGTRDYRSDLLRTLPDLTAQTLSYHFGAEYRVLRWLPIRGGVALLRYDPDRRDGSPPNKGIRASVGAGTYWAAIGSQIDLAFAHEHSHFSPLDPSSEIGSGDQAVLTVSRLF
ncbi:MAG TPA: hypothetical protein VK123_01615 [Candidatus Limnocylindrales bacterium]|nr:hypothetical protein [Candidatus Limnocylindrales bacterium]